MSLALSDDMRRILEAGNAAPSGENCQPWHFVVRDRCIEVHLLPDRDKSAYSWGQRASYLANGAVVENMVIAASEMQYRVVVDYFPDKSNSWHVATLSLIPDSNIKPDPLVSSIEKRVTNRKMFSRNPLSGRERHRLTASIMEAGYSELVLVEDADSIRVLARVGSTNEEVMLGNRALHSFFFSHVNWTPTEDSERKIGFFIKTLELPSPAEIAFKVFRNWGVMHLLSKIRFTRIVARQNASTNAAAAAIGAFLIEDTEPLDFVKLGRTVERLWLTATTQGLWLQPLVGTLLFHLKIVNGESGAFSKQEVQRIVEAYADASRVLGASNRTVAFMFRIGHGDAPSARAIRYPIEDVVTIIS